MQAIPIVSLSPSFGRYESPNEYVEISAKFCEDFSSKLKIEGDSNGGFVDSEQIDSQKKKESHERNEDDENEVEDIEQVVVQEEEEEEEEEEFSFACTNPEGSPTSAADLFQNGEIRPVFPIFNRDLLFADSYDGESSTGKESAALWSPLKKLFVEEEFNNNNNNPSSSASESEELEGIPQGTYCEWSGKTACKKSNSTGFSKIWRLRDLVHRSNSDGKDAFVFLNTNSATRSRQSNESVKKMEMEEKERKSSSSASSKTTTVKSKANKSKTASSVHEKHYVRNRAKKEGDKRRSYLPYRQDLVGFFTNVNGMSRNVHPF
ncbi:uncharacterized protein LOC107428719 [Ziziphus jujuba]|uniref:Uncharacterized protein LOC107428719 n=2 Tax=Ziziphus jujuba TaxID=326968 RepID=A0ABM3I830_ZIZJJ|nr:uncharacterized protein LOC107428719 [Ziziphus jujuba]KAH7510733.1 hypothetical protein FEM48_ZijujUnG0096800 [Ziziphus jujuba var. spinosa]